MAEDTVSMDRLVRTYMASESEEDLKAVASTIETGQGSVLQLVRSLGEYLTSEEDAVRTKGLNLLSEVLATCPKTGLNQQSTRVLTTFYVEKLEDSAVVLPALRGILSLASFPHFGDAETIEVCEGLFSHVKMKAHVQSTRFVAFMLIDAFMTHHRNALKAQGDSFVEGYIKLAEGEKDPRNLLLAFSIDRIILTEFEVKTRIDDLFDITFCYFPITFKPPPGDPYGISADDLRSALRLCLDASPLLGPLAIPLFLEKVTATVGTTKVDTLETIALCIPTYGKTAVQPFGTQLWDALRLEIFQPINDQTEELALNALTALIRTLYPSSVEEVDGLAKDIAKESLDILREPEKSQARPAVKVVSAFLESSPIIAKYALDASLELLLKLFHNPDEASTRSSILDAMTTLLASLKKAAAAELYDVVAYTEPHKDEALSSLVSGANASSLRSSALSAIFEIVQIQGLLTLEELTYVAQVVSEVLVNDSGEDIRQSALEILRRISTTSPEAVEDTCLPLLFGHLPDTAPPREADDKRAEYWRTLAALKGLCLQPVLFEVLVIRLLTKLDIICACRPGDDSSTLDLRAAYAHAMLDTLIGTVSFKITEKHKDLPKYLRQLVPRLFSLFLRAALASDADQVAATPILIVDASRIITLLTQVASSSEQAKFVSLFYNAFETGILHTAAHDAVHLPKDVPFRPFEEDAPVMQKNLLPLLCSALVALHKEVDLPGKTPAAFVTWLSHWSLYHATNSLQRSSLLHAMSSIINKKLEDLSDSLEFTLDSYRQHDLRDPLGGIERRNIALEIWIWVGKALVVRSDNRIKSLIDDLLSLFPDEAVAWNAARALGRIGQGGEDILTKQNHAVVRLLHVQKFADVVFPLLIQGFKDSSNTEQGQVYLVALSSLSKHIPKGVLIPKMSSLLPLFFRCLGLPDADLRANVTDVFDALIVDEAAASTVIPEHAASLVKALLRLIVPARDDVTNMRLRMSALRCLGSLPDVVRYDILHPLQATVISELGKAIDDRKRSVRKEAVDARAKWYTYHG